MLILVTGLSIGYSAFSSKLNITGIVTEVRLKNDIRITGLTLDSSSNQGQSIYNEYNKINISMGVKLPQNTSTVTYKVEVTNIGNVEMGISSIEGLPEYLDYELTNYKLKEKICDTNNVCKLGIKKEFYITIKYKGNQIPVTPTGYESTYTYNLNLKFNFKQAYNVTYEGITNNNYPSSVLEGETLEVQFTNPIPKKVVPYINDTKIEYTYSNNKITVPNVTGDIVLKYKEKVYLTALSEGTYFKESAYISKIKTVSFVDSIDIPSNVLKTYNLEENNGDEIKGWIDSNYNLYIGSEWEIYSKDLSYAFYNMTGVTNITFNNLNTIENTTLRYTFNKMSSLTSLDVSSFNTSNVTNMSRTFSNLTKLTTLNLSSFNTANVTNMANMFNGTSSLTTLNLSNFNTAKVTNMSTIFADMSSLTSLDISSFDTANVTNMESMFYNCSKITTLDLSHFNTAKVTDMRNMFNTMSNLTSLDISSFNTAKVTNMHAMFNATSNLTSLDLSHFNTANVTTMRLMFQGTFNITTLNVSHFNTSKVTDMYAMFSDARKITTLDISSFDTAKVTNMGYMFYNCNKLTELDLSSFDTSKVTNMSYMFNITRNLNKILVSNKWVIGTSTTTTNMFTNSGVNGVTLKQ